MPLNIETQKEYWYAIKYRNLKKNIDMPLNIET